MSRLLERLRFELPGQWMRIPDRVVDDAHWAQVTAATAPEVVRTAVISDLLRVAAASRDPRHPARTAFVRIDGPTGPGDRVTAYLTVDVLPVGDAAHERYLAAIRAAHAEPRPSAAVGQRVLDSTLAGHPAVIVHDHLAVPSAEGMAPALQERAVAAVFPADAGALVEFQITTPDLAMFPDIVDDVEQIAETLEWTP